MTPQEKKDLSYSKDRRNTYGENSKASRKSIPSSKALGIRSQRHTEDVLLRQASQTSSVDSLVAIENLILEPNPNRWKKSADQPLGMVLKSKGKLPALALAFVGVCDGPSDLSTNPIHMEGFGADNVYTNYLRELEQASEL
jgi:hypothetical protein